MERAEEARLKALWEPLNNEKPRNDGITMYFGTSNSKGSKGASAVAAPPQNNIARKPPNTEQQTTAPTQLDAHQNHVPAEEECSDMMAEIEKLANSDNFQNLKRGSAPAGIVAAATWITANVIPTKVMSKAKKQAKVTARSLQLMEKFEEHFGQNMYMVIPECSPCQDGKLLPLLHSMQGQKYILFSGSCFPPRYVSHVLHVPVRTH